MQLIRCDRCVLCARSVRELRNSSACGHAHDEKDQAHHQEEEEQQFGDSQSGSSNTGESKSAATSAVIKEIKAHRNISSPPLETNRIDQLLRVFFA